MRHGEGSVGFINWAVAANVTLLALYVAIAAVPGVRETTTVIGAAFLILGCLFVSQEAWKTSRRHNPTARGWFYIALTYVASAVGWIIASILVAIDGRLPNSPHWMELVFFSAYVFGMLGILYLGGGSARQGASWSRMLDGVIVTSALGVAIWSLFLSRILDIPGLTLAQQVGGLVFPAADLILLTAVILLVSRDRYRLNASLAYVCGAILLIVCADLMNWYVSVLEPTASQAPIPALFLGSTLLMMLGARAARRASTPPPQAGVDGRRLVFVPYVPVALAFAIALPRVVTTGTVDAVTLAVGVLMITAVLGRQYIALTDNQRLVRDARKALQIAAAHARDAQAGELHHRQVLDALDDVVCIVRRDGKISWASGAFERICGVPSDEAAGRRVTDFLEPLSPSDGPIRVDVPFQREAIAKTLTGNRLQVELTVLDAEPPLAGPGGRILILRDVTDRKRVEAERVHALRQQGELDRLEEMNRFKSSFLNMAAHELGTPLTPLRIQLHLLQQLGNNQPERTAQSLAMITRNVDRLSDLVRDILDASRIQSARIALRPQHVNLAALAQETLESYRVVADASGINLRFTAPPVPSIVCDPGRVAQVVLNFLSNAVKFTPRNGVIKVAVEERSDGVALTVTDSGIGLTDAQMDLLFKPFSQAHTPDPRRGGTGLGLYISRGIIEASGGHVWATSRGPGNGTTFGFLLPRETTTSTQAQVPVGTTQETGNDVPNGQPTQVAQPF